MTWTKRNLRHCTKNSETNTDRQNSPFSPDGQDNKSLSVTDRIMTTNSITFPGLGISPSWDVSEAFDSCLDEARHRILKWGLTILLQRRQRPFICDLPPMFFIPKTTDITWGVPRPPPLKTTNKKDEGPLKARTQIFIAHSAKHRRRHAIITINTPHCVNNGE